MRTLSDVEAKVDLSSPEYMYDTDILKIMDWRGCFFGKKAGWVKTEGLLVGNLRDPWAGS